MQMQNFVVFSPGNQEPPNWQSWLVWGKLNLSCALSTVCLEVYHPHSPPQAPHFLSGSLSDFPSECFFKSIY